MKKKNLKRRPLNKEELGKLRLDVTEKGFTLWGWNGTWLLDGSLFFQKGTISFCNNNDEEVKLELPLETDEFGHHQIILTTPEK